jgi:hypothetical protein
MSMVFVLNRWSCYSLLELLLFAVVDAVGVYLSCHRIRDVKSCVRSIGTLLYLGYPSSIYSILLFYFYCDNKFKRSACKVEIVLQYSIEDLCHMMSL